MPNCPDGITKCPPGQMCHAILQHGPKTREYYKCVPDTGVKTPPGTTPTPGPTTPAPAPDDNQPSPLSGLTSKKIFGIPVIYAAIGGIAIAAVLFMVLKKK